MVLAYKGNFCFECRILKSGKEPRDCPKCGKPMEYVEEGFGGAKIASIIFIILGSIIFIRAMIAAMFVTNVWGIWDGLIGVIATCAIGFICYAIGIILMVVDRKRAVNAICGRGPQGKGGRKARPNEEY